MEALAVRKRSRRDDSNCRNDIHHPALTRYFCCRTFKVDFSSTDKAADFRDMFAEGKDLAEQSEILETVGDQDPSHFYYGQVV